MLEYLKTQDSVELEKKIQASIEVATLHRVNPRVIHSLWEELECLRFMTAYVKNGVVEGAVQESARPAKTVSSEGVIVKGRPEIIHDDPS